MLSRKFWIVSVLALFVSATSGKTAHAQNLVIDPGFETAVQGNYNAASNSSFDNGAWTVTQGIVSVFANNQYSHTGNQSLDFRTAQDTVQQVLTTIAGTHYDLSFYAYVVNQPNLFSVAFDGSTVYNPFSGLPSTNSGTLAYRLYSFTDLLASTNSTALSFTAGTSAQLDDVSVTPSVTTTTPEPGAFATLTAIFFCGVAFRKKRRS